MGADQGTRVLRVAKGVRDELAALLGGEVRDPRAAGAVVTRVDLSSDLRSARVHVRMLEGGDDADRRKAFLAALGRAAGMLRREVTQRLGLRHAPDLRFVYDDGAESTARVEQLLAEIEAERRR